ncbi:MAG: T9SS type A sorting domain-containing protein [Flavicella sp.]|nr:T9SS type A sorting domain-containing protein [Flavicella sp.]
MKQFYPLVLIALIFGLVSMKPSSTDRLQKNSNKPSKVFISSTNTPEITISPNPVQKELRLHTSSSLLISSLEIHNISGKLIKTCAVKDSKIDVHNLPTGIYYLKISTSNTTITSRFIKK